MPSSSMCRSRCLTSETSRASTGVATSRPNLSKCAADCLSFGDGNLKPISSPSRNQFCLWGFSGEGFSVGRSVFLLRSFEIIPRLLAFDDVRVGVNDVGFDSRRCHTSFSLTEDYLNPVPLSTNELARTGELIQAANDLCILSVS